MLFKRRFLDGLAAGTITLAFRRWRRPTVREGGRLRTAVGVLQIDEVRVIADHEISGSEARRAGYTSRAELLRELGVGDGRIHRIALRVAGPDPRVALRARDRFEPGELAGIRRRLDRFDARSPRGPWTTPVLQAIADRPGTRAADLAGALGRDTPSFKTDVRKLKELGLTESLEVGYRLSPRGRAVLRGLAR